MQLPQVYPCVVVLGVFDHKLCLPPLNLELPPTPREVSLGLFIEDGLVLSIGRQLDGDIGEGVRDVTGHHCRIASRHRQDALRADRVVPACMERMVTYGQGGAVCRTVAGCSCRPWAEAGDRTSERQDEISHTDWIG